MVNPGRKLTVAILLLGAGILLEAKGVAAQEYCMDCIDDPTLYEHRLSVQPPPWGWYSEPCGSHFWPVRGWCLFNHDAGCFHEEEAASEDGDIFQQIARSEGATLQSLVESRSEDVLFLEPLGIIGIRGCDDGSVVWMPLREAQIRALVDVNIEPFQPH